MTQIYNRLSRFRRKPAVHDAVHAGEPIDPLPYERRLAALDRVRDYRTFCAGIGGRDAVELCNHLGRPLDPKMPPMEQDQ